MTLYDYTTITILVSAHASTQAALKESLPDAGGTLLGCWTSDVGVLNKLMVLRAFDSSDALLEAREAMLQSESPFGLVDGVNDIVSSTFKMFPFMPDIAPGSFGPTYELRMYTLRHGHVPRTVAAWKDAVPNRVELSPLLGVMYSLDGHMPRMLHVWGYSSPDARARIRAEAAARKVWPPVGGPASILEMESTLAVPTAFSPLQ